MYMSHKINFTTRTRERPISIFRLSRRAIDFLSFFSNFFYFAFLVVLSVILYFFYIINVYSILFLKIKGTFRVGAFWWHVVGVVRAHLQESLQAGRRVLGALVTKIIDVMDLKGN